MALMRVYCGVATAELAPWLTVAVVDDSGRLLDVRHVSDDPSGYASLVAALADRTTGTCPVAVDHHGHIVAQLVAAASRPLAVPDEMSLHDFTERFADESSYEEMQAPASQRCAVGLARAVQAGALSATAQSPSWNLDELKPVLSAHAALVAGRQASAAALREVLRELYPAALRAYLDPAELIPLKVLEAFPEPGLLGSAQSTQAVVAELAATGVTDAATATNAVTALRVAAEESRGRANPYLAQAAGEAVRQAVAAVRACDAAVHALVASLVDRLTAALGGASVHPAAAPVSPAVPRLAADTMPVRTPVSAAAPDAAHIPAPRHAPAHADAQYAANGAVASASASVPRRGGWEEQFGPPPGAPAPTSPAPPSYGPDTLSFSTDPLTAPLEGAVNGHRDAPPADGAGTDDDLLIFSQANSVWFTNSDDDTQITWTNLASDDGWRAAGLIAEPSVGPDTMAGLPKRVPQANLVPGSVTPAGSARLPRIVRDPRRIAAHTEGYFRGWRRGQEVGGFAVGQRDRGAWEFNREQRARQGAARLS